VDADGSGAARSLVLMYRQATGGGGDDPDPWVLVRSHVLSSRGLNPDGGRRTHPDGWPSLGWDPVGNTPEVTWARHDGNDYEIVVARWEDGHWTDPVALTDDGTDDREPEIAYAPDGTARITFWRGDQVYLVTRPPGGSWSAPELVDAGVRSSVTASTEDRVAWQRDGTDGTTEIVAAEKVAGGWVPTVLASTSFAGLDGTGDIDVRLEGTGTKVWVAWEDSADSLGWCELLPGGTWSAPRYEPLSGPDDEEAARFRIRLQALR